MGIQLQIHGREGFYLKNDVVDPLFRLRLSNMGIHWRYLVDYLTPQEIQQRNQDTNIAPIDRDLIFSNMSAKGWQAHLPPLINHVQHACKNEAPEINFLNPPDFSYTFFNPNEKLLTWQHDLKFIRANDCLNHELDKGIDLDANEFNERFELLSDSVLNGTLDEFDLLERYPIKAKI